MDLMEKASQGSPKREVLHFPLINLLSFSTDTTLQGVDQTAPCWCFPRNRMALVQSCTDVGPAPVRWQGPGCFGQGLGGTYDIPISCLSRELPPARPRDTALQGTLQPLLGWGHRRGLQNLPLPAATAQPLSLLLPAWSEGTLNVHTRLIN